MYRNLFVIYKYINKKDDGRESLSVLSAIIFFIIFLEPFIFLEP